MKNKGSKIFLMMSFVILLTGCGENSKENYNNKSNIKVENNIYENKKDISKVESEKEEELYKVVYDLFFENKYDEAIEKSNLLINEFPKSYKGYNIRGIAKAYNGNYEEGMKDIDKALDIQPKYGYALFNKALTYELYEKLDEAIEFYNKALEVEKYVWSYYGIASCYGRRGDVENTIKYLSEAIKLDESIKNHAREEVDFDPVRSDSRFINLIN